MWHCTFSFDFFGNSPSSSNQWLGRQLNTKPGVLGTVQVVSSYFIIIMTSLCYCHYYQLHLTSEKIKALSSFISKSVNPKHRIWTQTWLTPKLFHLHHATSALCQFPSADASSTTLYCQCCPIKRKPHCYRLNVCIPSKFTCWSPTSHTQCGEIGRYRLCKVIRFIISHDGEDPW